MSDWSDVRDAAHRTGDGWGWWLLDKNMEPLADLHGCVSIEIPESVNETSVLKLELRADAIERGLIKPHEESVSDSMCLSMLDCLSAQLKVVD